MPGLTDLDALALWRAYGAGGAEDETPQAPAARQPLPFDDLAGLGAGLLL